MLVAMSRIIWKSDFARFKSTALIRRSWTCLPLLLLAMPICSSLSLAQQNDHSVLVLAGSRNSAGSNAQAVLENELPQVTQQFLPPTPPASMGLDSDNAANFRRSAKGTLAAATSPHINASSSAVELIRATFDADETAQAASATLAASDSGTFTSQLPSGARSPNDSGFQTDNSFGASPASSSLRSKSASSTSRNRFGDFGGSPAPKAPSRFGPIPSSPNPIASAASKSNETAPPAQPILNRFASPAATPPSASQPLKPAAINNRFSSPAPTTGQRFPGLPKAAGTQLPQPNRPPVSQTISTGPISTPPIATSPIAKPQISTGRPIQPQATSQFPSSSGTPQNGSRFPAISSKFASPEPSNSSQSSSSQSRSFADSNLRPANSSSSRSAVPRGAGLNSNSERSPTRMIRRQVSSSSNSTFPNSSGAGQANLVSSQQTQQSSRFDSQSRQPSLRGNASNNDLRNNSPGNPTNNPTPTARRSVAQNQSSGKADRASIIFARQQLRNIQPTSADSTGTPVRLQELLLEPLNGSQRKQMVVQYWETYYDLAALKIATDYEAWLSSISTSGAEQGLLTAAQGMAADQQLAAKIQLGKSQSRLLDFMPNPRPNEFAPLPADEPLVEHYVTDYEKYKRVRALPTSLRGIDPMLASTLKLITQRAETVSTAKKAADQAGQSVRNRQIPLASAIAAGQLWRDAQLDMVASTISYNQAISDFVLTLEPNRSPEQLTAFMLGAPKNGSRAGSTSPQNQPTRSAANQPGWPANRQQFR